MTPSPATLPCIDRARVLPSGRRRKSGRAEISATIVVKNGERLLADVLTALQWCDEVVVLDTGSTDGTARVAWRFPNVSFHRLTGRFPGFGIAHQRAVGLARHDWILSIDADEIVSPELASEIRRLVLVPDAVYSIPFRNHYNGRHITTCGWSPDRHERLFNRRVTNFCGSEVHERVQTRALTIVPLHAAIDHYSYNELDDFVRKMGCYSRLFAEQNAGRRRASAFTACSRSAWAFFKSYVLERGITQGVEGLIVSAYKSQTVFWKYLMLRDANRKRAA